MKSGVEIGNRRVEGIGGDKGAGRGRWSAG